jgi:hypothetical protein
LEVHGFILRLSARGVQHLGKQWENRWGTGGNRETETGKQPELRDFPVSLPEPARDAIDLNVRRPQPQLRMSLIVRANN